MTRALLDAGHRAVGLCNVAIGNQRRWAKLLGVEASRLSLDHVGLNHLTWTRRVHLDGVDVLPQPARRPRRGRGRGDRAAVVAVVAARCACPRTTCGTSTSTTRSWRSSCAEPSRASRVAAIETELLELYADPTLDTKPACSNSVVVPTTPKQQSIWSPR